jgi:DnaK suppressor protein
MVTRRRPSRPHRWEKLLSALRAECERRLARWQSEAQRDRQPEDEAGLASQAQAEQVRLAELEHDRRLLAEIERALERLARGSFGRCERCQRPIGEPRLRALPWTRLCRDCADARPTAAGGSVL